MADKKMFYSKIFYLMFFKPGRFARHIINRFLFVFTMPCRGYAGKPFAFYVGINSKCNFRCKTCDAGQKKTDSALFKSMAGNDELALEDWKAIINRISSFKPYIEISALEPLLYPGILSVVDFIKNDKKLQLSITTNGFFLEKYASDLVRLKVDRVNVSIDGTKNIHDEIRGTPGAFDRAINGLRSLESHIIRPLIGVHYTISNYNYASLSDTIDHISRLINWDIFTFIHASFITDNMAFEQNKNFPEYAATPIDFSGLSLDKIDIDLLIYQVDAIRKRYDKRRVVFHPDIGPNDMNRYYRDPSSFILKKRCIMPWTSASILANGDVVAFNRCPTASFGNLLKDDFESIWNGKPFRSFRMALKKEGAFPVCSRCGSLKMK